MKTNRINDLKYFHLLSSILMVFAFTGCDGDDDENPFKQSRMHQPPAGQGAIVFDNRALKPWNVVIDGTQAGRVGGEESLIRDRNPGEYAVHLDEHRGDDTKDRTVGVVAGKLTIVEITGGSVATNTSNDFDVEVFVVDPTP